MSSAPSLLRQRQVQTSQTRRCPDRTGQGGVGEGGPWRAEAPSPGPGPTVPATSRTTHTFRCKRPQVGPAGSGPCQTGGVGVAAAPRALGEALRAADGLGCMDRPPGTRGGAWAPVPPPSAGGQERRTKGARGLSRCEVPLWLRPPRKEQFCVSVGARRRRGRVGTGTPLRPRACVVPARYRRSPPDPLAGSRVACSVPRTPQRVPVQAPLRATWCLRVAQGSSHLTCRVST